MTASELGGDGLRVERDDEVFDLEARSNLTRSQFLIWAGQKLAPGNPLYNMGWRFDLPLALNAESFTRAFDNVVQRCDTLRTVVEEVDGTPRQRVLAGPAGTLEIVSISGEAEATRWIDDRIRRAFDISTATFDSALLRLSKDRWIWFLNQHHLVTDAASGSVIFEEVARAYLAELEGRSPSLAPLPPFQTCAEAEKRDRNPDDAAFWRGRNVAGAPPPPLYGAPILVADPAAQRFVVNLGNERSQRLRALAEADGFQTLSRHQSVFNIFATALAAWVARVSCQRSFALGAITHGRVTPEARRSTGLFVELFPLEAVLAEGETFRSLHAKIAEETLTLLRHASPGASSKAGHGRFNAILNYIPVSFGAFAGATPGIGWLHPGSGDPKHTLRLSVMDFTGSGDFSLSLDLNESILGKCRAERAEVHILRIIDAFLADPDSAVDAVALAGQHEASVELTARADVALAEAEATPAVDVVEAFQRRVAEDPGAVVVKDDIREVLRAELDAWSDAIAQALADKGVSPGELVGVHVTRSSELVAAVLGTLKAGAAYVPLDPTQPPGRLDAIEAEAGLRLILTERRLKGQWQGRTERLLIDEVPRALATPWAPPRTSSTALPAYVIFTSGSTGVPKGVRIGRPALARYASWAHREFASGDSASWSLQSPIGFDLTVTSIFAPLGGGGRVLAYREMLDGPDLSVLRTFADDAVDIVKLTPSHLALVLEAGRPVRRIRTLVLGGEDLSVTLARRARAVLGDHLEIINEYGPTEATVGCMIHRFDPIVDVGPSVPIGRPAAATTLYVLDPGLNPVPDNVIGELYVSGPDRLADGYQNQEQMTAESFLPDPFAPGLRMYKTGDLASVAPTGAVRYHGRADEQVKIRGVRIEPAEIRRVVMSHPNVTDCALVMIEPASSTQARCRDCGLGSEYPDADIDGSGFCAMCRDYATYKERAATYFRAMGDLEEILRGAAARKKGRYDCLMLLSGGKDSSYALCRLAELTPRILAVTLDNGFISAGAKANIRRVTEALGIEHRFLTTSAMNAIFVDSLKRHANVCNGCFKTIYTLGLKTARDEGIPLIVTGLSRGQMFETRLAPELFQENAADVAEIDRFILEARKTYHRVDDAAARLLNCGMFDTDDIFDEIEFVDFYRYCDVPLDEVYAYLATFAPWTRPKDTGRSTNCLINDVGIHVHKRRRGFHNYALPYSWDVRMGHKSREAALEELDDQIDEDRVSQILEDIGFDEPVGGHGTTESQLLCYLVTSEAVAPTELRRFLAEHLPREMIPAQFVQVSSIPLTPNGKVDRKALLDLEIGREAPKDAGSVAPRNAVEASLRRIWGDILELERLGVEDNFFDLGGDSIAAIRIASRATAAGYRMDAVDVLRNQTIASLATTVAQPGTGAALARPEPASVVLDEKARARLVALFGTHRNE